MRVLGEKVLHNTNSIHIKVFSTLTQLRDAVDTIGALNLINQEKIGRVEKRKFFL